VSADGGEPDRLARGRETMARLMPDGGQALMEALDGVAPGLGGHVAAFAFGDVYGRPGLDLHRRQLVTIASLTTLGGTERQLALHVRAALEIGLSREEVVEAMVQCLPYAGFPRVINAVTVVGEVADAAGADAEVN
jgi:4-carboxymuconolactone decarboxylase